MNEQNLFLSYKNEKVERERGEREERGGGWLLCTSQHPYLHFSKKRRNICRVRPYGDNNHNYNNKQSILNVWWSQQSVFKQHPLGA